MKTNRIKAISFFALLFVLFLAVPDSAYSQKRTTKQTTRESQRKNTAQEKRVAQTPNVLSQNISIIAENEPLSKVIERICKSLNLDYSYNSKFIEGKNINLNVSNKPIKYVLDQLMKDFYLLFEIQDNVLIVRDYVPLDKSLEYKKNIKNYADHPGFVFDNPRKK